MKRICDLHMHSTASDGQYTPSELMKLAKERGLEVVALTDHDTTDGVAEAMEAGKALGLRVIPGIEMSAREYKTFHILGYGMDMGDARFQEEIAGLQDGRGERGERITQYLHEKGIPVDYDEVKEQALGNSIGRPHFAQVILKHGWCGSWKELFDNYLDTDEFHAKVENKPSVRECIENIKSARGTVSLAHPWQIGIDNDALDALVRQLKDMGLDAIECYYPKHTPEQTAFYLSLTEKYELHVTGGSDFHGEKVKPDVKLARLELDLEWISQGKNDCVANRAYDIIGFDSEILCGGLNGQL